MRPVGATAEQVLDVRIISATHRDLEAEVRAGRFRQDLYYRLNVIQVRVPPLRERLDDLPLLCETVLARIAAESGLAAVPRLTPAALARLARHDFPGNVRELENLLHRVVALSGGGRVDVDDLGLPGGGVPAPPAVPPVAAPAAAAGTGPAGPVGPTGEPPLPADLMAHLDEVEREVLVRALALHRGNRTAAAAAIGLTLRQMRYRMSRLGVQAAGDGSDEGEEGGA